MTLHATPTQASTAGLRASDFRMHALDLDPGLVSLPENMPDEVPVAPIEATDHWLLTSRDYRGVLRDLVRTVRELHRLGNSVDVRTDAELGADLIEGMGLWDQPEAHGPWGNTRLMTKFLWAFAKTYLHAKAHQGVQMRKNLKQDYVSDH